MSTSQSFMDRARSFATKRTAIAASAAIMPIAAAGTAQAGTALVAGDLFVGNDDGNFSGFSYTSGGQYPNGLTISGSTPQVFTTQDDTFYISGFGDISGTVNPGDKFVIGYDLVVDLFGLEADFDYFTFSGDSIVVGAANGPGDSVYGELGGTPFPIGDEVPISGSFETDAFSLTGIGNEFELYLGIGIDGFPLRSGEGYTIDIRAITIDLIPTPGTLGIAAFGLVPLTRRRRR